MPPRACGGSETAVLLTPDPLSDTYPQSDTSNFSLNCYSIPTNFDILYLVYPFNTMHHFVLMGIVLYHENKESVVCHAWRLMPCRSFNPRAAES
jgi:hypothetical protein